MKVLSLILGLLGFAVAASAEGYAGSAACAQCHQEEFEAWTSSHHALAERETPTNRIIGCAPLIQFLVKTNGGRWQASNMAWDPLRQETFDVFGSNNRQLGEWGHWTGRGMNWNSRCAFCHNTDLRKNYDSDSDSYQTSAAEMGVGCEACHGPAKAHVAWQQQRNASGAKDPTLARLSRRQELDACGVCHSRRTELTGDFIPGDQFLDHFDLAMVDDTAGYFPDGQVHEEDYEYASFLGSKMGASGVACWDCHEPHSAKIRLPGNFLCLRCHNGGDPKAPVINPATHSHHRVRGCDSAGKIIDTDLLHFQTGAFAETGGECINCHMPVTTYMQRHARRDHGFTVPDPLLTKERGIPNACSRCHKDKSVDWAISAVDQGYGAKMKSSLRQRTREIAAARAREVGAEGKLLTELAAETNSYWRAAIINVLQPWSAEAPVATALRPFLKDPDALVRNSATRVLADDVDALRQLLTDPVRAVRVTAAWALRAELDSSSLAARDLERSFAFNADQPGGQLQMGEFLAGRGDLPQALEHYHKAAAWDPRSAPIHHDLAVVLSALNQNKDAVEELRQAVQLEPADAEYHFSLALALNEAGELDGAIAEFREAVRLDPKDVDALRNLGLALAQKNDLNGAEEELRKAAQIAPDDPRISSALASVRARIEQKNNQQ